ncbi:MAG: hypothetical protein ACLP78_00815 [Thermoplasmata archaeon]
MTDWPETLAATILEDRVDQGVTRDDAGRRARRYQAWLNELPKHHDRRTCPEETQIRNYPGDLCFHTGRATVFVARQGAGKTNTLSYLIENAIEHRPEWDIYTNVPYPWSGSLAGNVPAPPHLHAVASMSQLLRGVVYTILADRIPAVAIDEMDQATTSHEWASERSESWTKFLYVERHFRVRGPLLAYHVYEHVPLPLRRIGDLRGSYFRVVILGGDRLLARVEDTAAWWGIRESILPYLTLGLRGFDLDVDMTDLERHLGGGHRDVARQTIAYLDEFEQRREEEADRRAEEARAAHVSAVVARNSALAERDAAFEARNEEIVSLLVEHPETTTRAIIDRYHTGSEMIARLRSVARERARRPLSGRLAENGERGTAA